jgi:hypothetical protein
MTHLLDCLLSFKSPKVGDKIRVSMHGGRIVDAVIKAILDGYTDGMRYQVDFGNSQTALIRRYQIVKE